MRRYPRHRGQRRSLQHGERHGALAEAQSADADGPLALSQAVYRLRQTMPAAIGFDEGLPMSGLGLGWVWVAPEGVRPGLLTKSGGGAGFMSYVAFAPGRDVGVFLAVNRVDFPMFIGLTDAANKLIAGLATR